MVVGVFNRDNKLDTAFTDASAHYLGILFGNGDGTVGQ
jgi:hypothetical protein